MYVFFVLQSKYLKLRKKTEEKMLLRGVVVLQYVGGGGGVDIGQSWRAG
jgi:hypothetical protein